MMFSGKRQSRLIPYTLLALPIGALLVFFVGPMLAASWMSLHDYRTELTQPEFVGLFNYWRLLMSPPFLQAAWNTVLFWLAIVPAMVVLPLGLAVFLNRQFAGMGVVRLLMYLPVVTSLVVVGLAWKWLYARDGLINGLLGAVNIPPVDWLTHPDIALVAVSLVVVWKGLAYYMMMYIAHLQSLDTNLLEAARLDGANQWQQLCHVTVPHLRPMMAFVLVMSTIGTLKLFTEIYVLTGGGPLGSTQTWVYYLYEQAFGYLDLGLACAAGLLLMIVLLLVSWGQFKLMEAADG
jgi:putative chitobiose transport system permease protein